MKIVIDISEEDYRRVQDGRAGVSMMRNAIKSGTQLTDILDKIRAKVDRQYKWLINTRCTIRDVDIAFDSIFQFIDKYKAKREE